MNAELSRWVEDASEIAASGRWAAVDERIKQLGANPEADNAWWARLFSSLCASIFSEYLSLKRAYEDSRSEASLIAWRARNLLELCVWSTYCSRSTENAQRFYADGERDAAAAEGIVPPETRYKRVSDAAQGIGMGGQFAVRHRILSKFAHPTARQILGPPDDAKMTKQKDVLFSHGCHYFAGAFTALEKQINTGNADAT
jgi:hypothetical protein